MKQNNEEILREVWEEEYFQEFDNRVNPSKGDKLKLIERWQFAFLKFLVPGIQKSLNGWREIRYFEVVNKNTGEVRLIKAT